MSNGEIGQETPYSPDWVRQGLPGLDEMACVTVIRDVTPDEALRRLGLAGGAVSTTTWPELMARSEAAEGADLVAAFLVGTHALLVESNGAGGVQRRELSEGTLAVSSFCSINGDVWFVVTRDGTVLAELDGNAPGSAFGVEPAVLTEALSGMGITDREALDDDPDNIIDDLELLCRVSGIRPTVAEVSAVGRVVVLT